MHSGYIAVICNRWIDEAKGTRCDLLKGHEGPCQSVPERWKGTSDGR